MNSLKKLIITTFLLFQGISYGAEEKPNINETYNLSSLPKPYSELKKLLPFNAHGWYNNGQFLEKLIKHNNVKKVIEVGSWLGTSTRHIATQLPESGTIIAIDTWEGSSEHINDPAFSKVLETLYDQFLSNVVHTKLTNKIIPLRKPSLDAVSGFSQKDEIDLIYIDAGHETELVLKDLEAWYPIVKGRGILCGDDWSWESVRKAAIQFAKKNNLTVYGGNNFYFFVENGEFSERSLTKSGDSIWLRKS